MSSIAAFSVAKAELYGELSSSFSRLATIYDEETNTENRRGQLVLKLNCENLRVLLIACRDNVASDYSCLDSEFESIVTTASVLANETMPHRHRFQSFSFSHGLIYPLYIAATCCCDISVCQQAIIVLGSMKWAEGVWNGRIMAKIADRKLNERFEVQAAT